MESSCVNDSPDGVVSWKRDPAVLYGRVYGPDHYALTSHTEHDHKRTDGLLTNGIYSKAPPHWITWYPNDLARKTQRCWSVCPPVSEMKDQFREWTTSHKLLVDRYRTLKALHKQLSPFSTLLPGAVSTAHRDHRSLSRSDLAPLLVPDMPPLHGTLSTSAASSRLPPRKAPPSLSSYCQKPRLPLHLMAVLRPPIKPCPSPVLTSTGQNAQGWGVTRRHVMDVPKMYSTENQSYGRGGVGRC